MHCRAKFNSHSSIFAQCILSSWTEDYNGASESIGSALWGGGWGISFKQGSKKYLEKVASVLNIPDFSFHVMIS